MKTVAIISQKGGAGKTTLAVHLAVSAERDGKTTVVVDLDPQASATSWKRAAKKSYQQLCQLNLQLPNVLDVAKNGGVQFCIIDTAPHSESAALAAARSSDLILIPCRPAILDLRAISNTIDLAKSLAKRLQLYLMQFQLVVV